MKVNSKRLLIGVVSINVIVISLIGWIGYARWRDAPEVEPADASSLAAEIDAFVRPPRPPRPGQAGDGESASLEALWTAAFDAAERTVELLPREPAALTLLGKLHLRSGDVDGARQLWEQALRVDPGYSEAHLDLGYLAQNLEQLDLAEEKFEQAISGDGANLEARRALAETYVRQGRFEEAIEQLNEVLRREFAAPEVWCELGKAQQGAGKYAAAIESYRQATVLDGNSRAAVQGLMTAYRSAGDSEQAAEWAERFAELDQQFSRVADDRQETDLDQLKSQELSVFAIRTAADLLFRTSYREEALRLLSEGQQMVPESRELATLLAELYGQVAMYDRGLAALQRRTAAAVSDATAWMDLGLYALQLRRFDTADRALRSYLKLRPDDAEAYALLAQTQMPAERAPQRAVETARRAVELSPTAHHFYILATAEFHNGDLEDARDTLQQAIALDPDNSEYREALARLP